MSLPLRPKMEARRFIVKFHRNVELFRLFANGKTDLEIAQELFISINTVGNHTGLPCSLQRAGVRDGHPRWPDTLSPSWSFPIGRIDSRSQPPQCGLQRWSRPRI